ncbi:MAG: excinuclease ABC subunit UvrC, partial [Syntrophobacterales bacterium]|nr:excinuclease ABC subunit UvrC [Syntrophobacterales bacterium]
MNETLQQKIKYAPRATGVYLMKDKDGKILYVGKSKDLKSRIQAYFSGTDGRFMIPYLVSRIHDIDFILAATEKEALILENGLIKQYRPRYNVNFRDDKAYFNIRIDGSDPFPLFELVRKVKRDGAFYFGPYPSSAAAKETLQFLQSVFHLRTCKDKKLKTRKRPCVEYQIKRCCAPCVGFINPEDYGRMVGESIAFLDGRSQKLIRQLEGDMKAASQSLRFEEAAILRDRINAVRKTVEKQAVTSRIAKDQDVWGIAMAEERTQFCLLYIRGGKIIGKRSFGMQNLPLSREDTFSS